jgi:tetratricopeptide (TPR) repeat protein
MTSVFGSSQLQESARALRARGAWSELALLLDDHLSEVRCQPELATLRGESYLRAGSPRESRAWFADAIPVIERRGDRSALRRAINMIGVAEFQLGELEAAGPLFERAMELGQQDGDDLLVARATNNLGAIANIRAQRDRALGLYSIAAAAYQRLGDPMGLAECYHNMAISFRDTGDLERADDHELRAIEFAREADNPRLIAQARLGRAEIGLRKGDAAFAEAAAMRAASDFAELPEPIQEADALRLVGVAALAQGKLAIAGQMLDSALVLARQTGGALNEAEILQARAALYARRGDRVSMRRDALAAMAIFERLQAHHDRQMLADWLRDQERESR